MDGYLVGCGRVGMMGISGLCTVLERTLRLMPYFGRNWTRNSFGPGESLEDVWNQRLDLLDERVMKNMASFVEKKLKDSKTRELAWDLDE